MVYFSTSNRYFANQCIFKVFFSSCLMLKLLLFSYFFHRMLQDSYVYYPGLRPEPENYIKCSGTNEMREEVEALEKKLFLEEIALDVTDERCHLLDRNLR